MLWLGVGRWVDGVIVLFSNLPGPTRAGHSIVKEHTFAAAMVDYRRATSKRDRVSINFAPHRRVHTGRLIAVNVPNNLPSTGIKGIGIETRHIAAAMTTVVKRRVAGHGVVFPIETISAAVFEGRCVPRDLIIPVILADNLAVLKGI